MPTGSNESGPYLLHFHVCKHCGAATRREEFEGRALTSGLFLCPKCGLEGPLNVEIREVQESQLSEAISIGLKRAAIALAEQLDYARAAEQLNIPSAELRKQVSKLGRIVCFIVTHRSVTRSNT